MFIGQQVERTLHFASRSSKATRASDETALTKRSRFWRPALKQLTCCRGRRANTWPTQLPKPTLRLPGDQISLPAAKVFLLAARQPTCGQVIEIEFESEFQPGGQLKASRKIRCVLALFVQRIAYLWNDNRLRAKRPAISELHLAPSRLVSSHRTGASQALLVSSLYARPAQRLITIGCERTC